MFLIFPPCCKNPKFPEKPSQNINNKAQGRINELGLNPCLILVMLGGPRPQFWDHLPQTHPGNLPRIQPARSLGYNFFILYLLTCHKTKSPFNSRGFLAKNIPNELCNANRKIPKIHQNPGKREGRGQGEGQGGAPEWERIQLEIKREEKK